VALPPHKEVYREVARSRIDAIKRLGVENPCGNHRYRGYNKGARPDVLIIATGSRPAVPDIAESTARM